MTTAELIVHVDAPNACVTPSCLPATASARARERALKLQGGDAGTIGVSASRNSVLDSLFTLAKNGAEVVAISADLPACGSETAAFTPAAPCVSFRVSLPLGVAHGLSRSKLQCLLTATGALPRTAVAAAACAQYGTHTSRSSEMQNELERVGSIELLRQLESAMRAPADAPELLAPKDVVTALYPHQRKALAHMIKREERVLEHSLPARPDPSYEPLELFTSGTGERVYLDCTNVLTFGSPPECDDKQSCSGCLFADETGLGKSLTMLSLSLTRPRSIDGCACTVIVAPPALQQQWADELRTHAPARSVRVYSGLESFAKEHKRSINAALKDNGARPRYKGQKGHRRAMLGSHGMHAPGNKKKQSKQSKNSSRTKQDAAQPCGTEKRMLADGSDASHPCGSTTSETDDDEEQEGRSLTEDGSRAKGHHWGKYSTSMSKKPSKANAATFAAEVLCQTDFVITSYNCLRSEVYYDGQCKYGLRYKTFEVPLCPLLQVHWRRAIFDESQKVGDSLNVVSQMATKMQADHKYAVTGTPLSDSDPIKDLAAHMRTIGHKPISDDCIVQHFRQCKSPAVASTVLHEAGWRSTKSSIEQLGSLSLPQVSVHRVSLELCKPERVFYDHTMKVSASNRTGWSFVTQLRLACIHPQLTANWRNASSELQLESGALGINEVVERLMHTSRGKLQKYERDYCSSLKNIAATESDPFEASKTLREAYDVAENGLLSKGSAEGSVHIEVSPASLRLWQLVQMEVAKRAELACVEIKDDAGVQQFADAAQRLSREFLDPSNARVDRLQKRIKHTHEQAIAAAKTLPRLRHNLNNILEQHGISKRLTHSLLLALSCNHSENNEDHWAEDVIEEHNRLLSVTSKQQQQLEAEERDKNDDEDDQEDASGVDDAALAFVKAREHEVSGLHKGLQSLGLAAMLSDFYTRLQKVENYIKESDYEKQHEAIMQVPPHSCLCTYLLLQSELSLSILGHVGSYVGKEDLNLLSQSIRAKLAEKEKLYQAEAAHTLSQQHMNIRNMPAPKDVAIAANALTRKQLEIIFHLKDTNRAAKQLVKAELQQQTRKMQADMALACSNEKLPARDAAMKQAAEDRKRAETEANRVRFLQNKLEEFTLNEEDRGFDCETNSQEQNDTAKAENMPHWKCEDKGENKSAALHSEEVKKEGAGSTQGTSGGTCPVCLCQFVVEAMLLPCGHMVRFTLGTCLLDNSIMSC